MTKFDKRKLRSGKWLASLFEKHRVRPELCVSLKREGKRLCGCAHGPLAIELGFLESPEFKKTSISLGNRACRFLDRIIGDDARSEIAHGFDSWPFLPFSQSAYALAANRCAHTVFGKEKP